MLSVHRFCLLVGKTTLADSLIASNGIISQRHVGKVCTMIFTRTFNVMNCNVVYVLYMYIYYCVCSYDIWMIERMNRFVGLQ